VNYNEENAVMALLDLIEKKAQLNQENAKKKREHEEERVKAEAFQQVQALFENIPKEEIQGILDNNFGHVNRTIDDLLQRIKAKEEETQTENRRQRLITDLATRYSS
jgi:hypothetical protein